MSRWTSAVGPDDRIVRCMQCISRLDKRRIRRLCAIPTNMLVLATLSAEHYASSPASSKELARQTRSMLRDIIDLNE
jgi:hypothetical protein